MATEIERKYLLDLLPDAQLLGAGVEIRQGYLAEEAEVEVRIRIVGDAATLTVKAGRGRTRCEVETSLTMPDATELWAHTAGRRIVKRRHRIIHGAQTIEVDVYSSDLAGLLVAEVEFASATDADEFVPPAWFATELTGPEWSNAALARHGRPQAP